MVALATDLKNERVEKFKRIAVAVKNYSEKLAETKGKKDRGVLPLHPAFPRPIDIHLRGGSWDRKVTRRGAARRGVRKANKVIGELRRRAEEGNRREREREGVGKRLYGW